MNLKDTLLMPKTSFNMKASLAHNEPKFQKNWEETKVYQQVMEKNEGKPLFILHDGPPYANGDLHAGHAFNKTLKDFIIRSKNMAGFKAPMIMGWDTHGLPIENALLKKGKVKMNKLTTL
nr:class I tRNA ligase family protein [Mycoplasmatales bacterium]